MPEVARCLFSLAGTAWAMKEAADLLFTDKVAVDCIAKVRPGQLPPFLRWVLKASLDFIFFKISAVQNYSDFLS